EARVVGRARAPPRRARLATPPAPAVVLGVLLAAALYSDRSAGALRQHEGVAIARLQGLRRRLRLVALQGVGGTAGVADARPRRQGFAVIAQPVVDRHPGAVLDREADF